MKSINPTVVMVGLGYIGLPTATLKAEKGLNVTSMGVREDIVNKINKGEIHIVEPGLKDLVHHVVKEGRLKAVTKPLEADVLLIAVPTRFKENYKPDLRYTESAINSIIPNLNPDALVIIG